MHTQYLVKFVFVKHTYRTLAPNFVLDRTSASHNSLCSSASLSCWVRVSDSDWWTKKNTHYYEIKLGQNDLKLKPILGNAGLGG